MDQFKITVMRYAQLNATLSIFEGISVMEVTATDDDTTESFKEFQYSIQCKLI